MDQLVEPKGEAAETGGDRPLYKKRAAIHPKLVFGRYRQIKWAALAVLLAVYYLLPWVRYDRGPAAPDQAVLIDVPARKFYFFFIEIWPQEVYYWTGLLIVAAVGLFFISSLFGRVWCGYACPQTVWTDLFIYIERLVEGDRNARIKLAAAPWGPLKIGKKALKHAIWIAIGLATGGAWVFYFADAPTLFHDLIAGEAPLAAYLTIAILTATTYAFAGFAREQICTYVCPYARFQAAMFDEDTMLVSYQAARGEPRGSHKKGASWEGRGHCVDCNQCVVVCPMGIDIRNGQQMECITCALCIDACNGVMDKVGLPRGLIRYDTLRNMQARAAGQVPRVRLIRIRTLVYAGVLLAAAAAILISLASRADLDITVQRDRNPVYVTLSNGDIRNGYTIKVLNKAHEVRSLVISAEGLPGAGLEVQGHDVAELRIGPDQIEAFRVFVRVPGKLLAETSSSFAFVLTEAGGGTRAEHGSVFVGPKR
ncbi:MAG: cytochrome c oxidase accessory protein CcoG [Alphaproteobacteria bacterium]